MDRDSAVKTFRDIGGNLCPVGLRPPSPGMDLKRIFVRNSGAAGGLSPCGPWQQDNITLTQYAWVDETPSLNSNTALLRRLQNKEEARRHTALVKWGEQLGVGLPESAWQET